MKKIVLSVFVMLFAVVLAACGGKTYAVDGVYKAFEASDHSNGVAMITWVEVTIEKGEVKSFNIDARQATVIDGTFAWNAKSKKELGYAYRMHGQRDLSEADYKAYLAENNLKEWFEQAALIEAFFLTSTDLTTNADSAIDNVTGVTIKDGHYSALAKEALANAKANKFVEFKLAANAQVTWIEVTTDKAGKATKFSIDVLQSTENSWNAKSKKELGYAYRMHGQRDLSEADYKAYLAQNNLKEWFEQAALIEAFFLTSTDLTTNANSAIDNVTGVTIKDGDYSSTAKAALANIAK